MIRLLLAQSGVASRVSDREKDDEREHRQVRREEGNEPPRGAGSPGLGPGRSRQNLRRTRSRFRGFQAACDAPETRETRTASASGPLSPADFQICPPHAGQ